MPEKDVKHLKNQRNLEEVSALCYEALQKLGPSGHFRVRVLLEMIIIQLAVDAPSIPQPDTPSEP